MARSSYDVTHQYQDLARYYRAAHNLMARAGRMHDQEYDGIIDVPYEVRVFLSSTASNIIDGFRNQLRTHEPTVDFQVTGSTREAMKEAVMMQRWGYSALRREREQ